MIARGNNNISDSDVLPNWANFLLVSLSEKPVDCQTLATWLNQFRFKLKQMAMSTSMNELVGSRISNAERFLKSGEPGAAKYELQLLVGSLQEQP